MNPDFRINETQSDEDTKRREFSEFFFMSSSLCVSLEFLKT
jgi:hypothetical protein